MYIKQVSWPQFVLHCAGIGNVHIAEVDIVRAVSIDGQIKMQSIPHIQASCTSKTQGIRLITERRLEPGETAHQFVDEVRKMTDNFKFTTRLETNQDQMKITKLDALYIETHERYRAGTASAYDLFKIAAFEAPNLIIDAGDGRASQELKSFRRKLCSLVVNTATAGNPDFDVERIPPLFEKWASATEDKNIAMWESFAADLRSMFTSC